MCPRRNLARVRSRDRARALFSGRTQRSQPGRENPARLARSTVKFPKVTTGRFYARHALTARLAALRPICNRIKRNGPPVRGGPGWGISRAAGANPGKGLATALPGELGGLPPPPQANDRLLGIPSSGGELRSGPALAPNSGTMGSRDARLWNSGKPLFCKHFLIAAHLGK